MKPLLMKAFSFVEPQVEPVRQARGVVEDQPMKLGGLRLNCESLSTQNTTDTI